MATPRWTCLAYLLILSVVAFCSEAHRVPPAPKMDREMKIHDDGLGVKGVGGAWPRRYYGGSGTAFDIDSDRELGMEGGAGATSGSGVDEGQGSGIGLGTGIHTGQDSGSGISTDSGSGQGSSSSSTGSGMGTGTSTGFSPGSGQGPVWFGIPGWRSAVRPWFGIPGFGIHSRMPGFGSGGGGNHGSGGVDETQPGTGALVCTPVNCPSANGLCGVIYINLEPEPSKHGHQAAVHHQQVPMAPSPSYY